MRWNYTPVHAERVAELARQLGTNEIVAELLMRIGHVEPEPATRFLQPTLATLADPFLVAHLDAAVARLIRALERRENVIVLGDYDVDGVSSTTLLVDVLRRLGLQPRYVVPRRLEEGYGLTRVAIDRALEVAKPDLFVALDCGTNSHDEVTHLRSLGVDVIVVDHHRSKETPTFDALLINPHVHNVTDDHSWRHCCTVGLVFKLLHGLLKQLRAQNYPGVMDIRLRDYLDLVAMGTIADLVPLAGENRIFAKHGLHVLAATQRPGLRALMNVAGLKPENGLAPVDISFRLGPRINASGRLADASLSVDLLLSQDPAFCRTAAQQLDDLNKERQEIERQITEQAETYVEKQFAEACGFVLYDESWHPGVVGIVAGRISRKFNRPAIVLGNEGDLAKGSGRGVSGVNLVELLGGCQGMLESWGGHPMAVGVALRKARIEEFRAQFNDVIRARRGLDACEPVIELSGWLDGQQVTEKLMDELDQLHPFGQGNPEPIFGVRGLRLRSRPEIFKEQHFRFTAEDVRGRRLSGVAWKLADRLPPAGQPLELAVQLNWNFYAGRKSLQLELLDWRVA
ncbi:single-stranded-DNA-specific exonuclease RecJ [Oleiharenicola sp. Vm1]|uniref:single-stranded-DNA-specific exonuclease RecJ n=1 Tax=Oleiharenicola sp. Vm1 TaxID=3398393 RepID=UPI0039F58E24